MRLAKIQYPLGLVTMGRHAHHTLAELMKSGGAERRDRASRGRLPCRWSNLI